MPRVALSIFDDVGNPHYGGGGARVVHEIATRLAEEHEVTVYCGSYRGSPRSVVRDGVEYVFLPVGWAGPRGGQVLFPLLLPVLARRRRPDVWIESLTPPVSTSLLPLLGPAPVVALVQMLSAADMQRRYRLPFTLVERWGLRAYRHVVVLNRTDLAAVRRYAPKATSMLIPNGVTRAPGPEPVFGAGEHILYLGRIDVRQKGLDLLLAAVAADPPPLPLVIAGAGTAREEHRLRELVRPVREHVRIAGRVGGMQKAELLRGSALVVVPSRFETFSLTALEAMAEGKPVVCFDLPQLQWIPAEAAWRIPRYDVSALSTALNELSHDKDRRAELGRCGHALSREHDWDVIGARYRKLISEVLDRRRGT
ncbi:glycosyltransferase family 4 protein [Actinoplanes sp. TFC3]|uniref:glycosyltransferase family 4 protein n=1 Tax=Actinoplanes sp. TFC3 TaxID=1710355 RepID=UPI00082E81C5|nr:glycosyltransferase family 4 protein [Actinoplanes sp. TFC3]